MGLTWVVLLEIVAYRTVWWWTVLDHTSPQGRENEMTVVAPERASGYLLNAGEGDAYWLLGMLEVVKISGAETGGAFGMVEGTVRAVEGSPWHGHQEESEWLYV